jgi:GAF domain-containing protein
MNNNPSPWQPPSQKDMLNSDAFNNKRWREQFILTILRIACVLGVALMLIFLPTATSANRIIFIGLFIFLLAITVLHVPYSMRAFSLLFMVFTIGANSILAGGPWLDGSIFFIAFIILSALLFDQHIDIFALLIGIITISLIATMQQLGFYQLKAQNIPVTTSSNWVGYIIDFSIVSAILMVAIGQFKRAFKGATKETQAAFGVLTTERALLEDRVRDQAEELETRTIQFRSSASVARTITEMQDISELMNATTRLISEQFGYYHVGLFLLDDRKKTAFLQAASSDTGKLLVGQGFHVEPDRLNIFNLVIEDKRPHVTLGADANFIRDINFPLTLSRMMLPFTVRGDVIGMMDLHSAQVQTFKTQDAEVLQTLADLVAISIDNVRLINETSNLVFQLEATTSLQTRETWAKFTSRHKPAYQYTPAGVRPLFSKNKMENGDGLRIPLILHGQNIGGIVLRRSGATATWSERERILAEKVADQVALALENSRLVDETQKNAMRNQIIANISTRVRETLDVESVIRTATTELRRVFDLKEAEVSIGAPQAEKAPVKKHTSSLRLK